MGKRPSKSELLAEIGVEREALDRLIEGLEPRRMTQPNVTKHGWSVKDILAHLVGWQLLNLAWQESESRGERPAVPAPGLTWKDVPKLNESIYRRHRRRSLKAVPGDYADRHEKMIDLIRKTSNADLVGIGRYSWTGPSWSLGDYLRANTASHYRWACKHIRRWSRSQRRS
jgi:hypothetical protein